MTILIDPARWPAHGTVFSHLVSDTSLEELHAFAQEAGISPRAFDRDHYDVPLHRYQDLVSRGAVEVSGAELVRRLVASGLRIPAARRPGKLDKVLRRRFDRLFPGHHDLNRGPVFQDLMDRWSEPHRHYHDTHHLLAVLNALDLLERQGADAGPFPRAIRLAAWFHDAVYLGDPDRPTGQDEEDSAVLAETVLDRMGLPSMEVEESARLVRLTVTHDPEEDDAAGQLFCDADLEVLGRSPQDYARYLAAVRQDFSHVSDDRFARGRRAVVQQLLALDPIYRTAAARMRWEDQARHNLLSELD